MDIIYEVSVGSLSTDARSFETASEKLYPFGPESEWVTVHLPPVKCRGFWSTSISRLKYRVCKTDLDPAYVQDPVPYLGISGDWSIPVPVVSAPNANSRRYLWKVQREDRRTRREAAISAERRSSGVGNPRITRPDLSSHLDPRFDAWLREEASQPDRSQPRRRACIRPDDFDSVFVYCGGMKGRFRAMDGAQGPSHRLAPTLLVPGRGDLDPDVEDTSVERCHPVSEGLTGLYKVRLPGKPAALVKVKGLRRPANASLQWGDVHRARFPYDGKLISELWDAVNDQLPAATPVKTAPDAKMTQPETPPPVTKKHVRFESDDASEPPKKEGSDGVDGAGSVGPRQLQDAAVSTETPKEAVEAESRVLMSRLDRTRSPDGALTDLIGHAGNDVSHVLRWLTGDATLEATSSRLVLCGDGGGEGDHYDLWLLVSGAFGYPVWVSLDILARLIVWTAFRPRDRMTPLALRAKATAAAKDIGLSQLQLGLVLHETIMLALHNSQREREAWAQLATPEGQRTIGEFSNWLRTGTTWTDSWRWLRWVLLGTVLVVPAGIAVWQTAIHVPAVGAAFKAALIALKGGKVWGAVKALPWWAKVAIATPFEYLAIGLTYRLAVMPRAHASLGSA